MSGTRQFASWAEQTRRKNSPSLQVWLCLILPALILCLLFGCGGTSSIPDPVHRTFGISGSLTPTVGGGGASVGLSGVASASTTADGSGNYSFTGLANGSYAVTPSHSGYSFSPSSQAVTISGVSVTGVNFAATPAAPTYTISGSVTPASSGAGSVMTLSWCCQCHHYRRCFRELQFHRCLQWLLHRYSQQPNSYLQPHQPAHHHQQRQHARRELYRHRFCQRHLL